MMEQQQLHRLLSHRRSAYRAFWLAFLALASLFLCACGPKVFIAPSKGERLRTIALLPPTYEALVPREKIDYLCDSFARKLAAKGFNVINPNSVKPFCANGICTDLSSIVAGTDSDALAKIIITSTNSTNLLAIHSNSISGSGLFLDRSSNEIAKVENTETQRGGILLDSGQVVEGIKSSFEALGDKSFTTLADRFIETIVSKLPSPRGTLDVADLHIEKGMLNSLGAGRYLACIDSDNAKSANIFTGKTMIPLRMAGPGKFCAGFLLDYTNNDTFAKSTVIANVTGRYGETKSIPLNQIPMKACSSEQAIKHVGDKVTWLSSFEGCNEFDFLVFQAPHNSGPFSLMGRLNKPGSSVSLRGKDSDVVAIVGESEIFGSSPAVLLK